MNSESSSYYVFRALNSPTPRYHKDITVEVGGELAALVTDENVRDIQGALKETPHHTDDLIGTTIRTDNHGHRFYIGRPGLHNGKDGKDLQGIWYFASGLAERDGHAPQTVQTAHRPAPYDIHQRRLFPAT